jgi:superoxide dismutase, Cu-Zn family
MAAQVQSPGAVASAQLHDRDGRLLATATFREASDQVQINVSFADRSALTGTHAIQIHESGRCEAPDFLSAGGIFNPFGKQHGLLNPSGPMAGDLPSLVTGPAGVGSYNLSAPLVRLSTGPAALLKPNGTALMIFERVDDDLAQPEGSAGARIACGVIVAGASGSAPIGSPIPSGDTRPDLPAALIIGGLGVLLIGAGLVLRQRRST